MTSLIRALRMWWDCANCGATNPPCNKKCSRCGS